MTSIAIRPAGKTDQAMLCDMVAAYYRFDGHAVDDDAIAASVHAALSGDAAVAVFIIEDDRTIAGYLALTFGFSLEAGGRDAFIDELFLYESHRGRGIGSRALDFAEQECRRRGARKLNLEVVPANTAAKAIYEARGFQDHRRFLMSKWL